MTDLIVDPGTEHEVTAAEQDVIYNRIEIGDDARIRFAADVDHWHVEAARARFGDRVVIDGKREGAANGRAGTPGSGHGPGERNGRSGGDGAIGREGIDVRLRLAFERVGIVELNVSGGDGGDGGRGGNGAAGRGASCSKVRFGTDGGHGGSGGAGGDGGDGGTVEIRFSYVSTPPPGDPEELPGFRIVSQGGDSGTPGKGGRGAPGGASKDCPLGPIQHLRGGRSGTSGSVGREGRDGRDGDIRLIPI